MLQKELCRKAVADGGDDPLVSDESSFPVMRRRKPTRKEKVFAANIIIPKILCPIHECGKALKDVRGDTETITNALHYINNDIILSDSDFRSNQHSHSYSHHFA